MKLSFSTLFFLLSGLSAETGYPAFDVFTSSAQLGLGGAGFLNPNSISSKLNPAVADTGRLFSTSMIRYPANIISQSAGVSFPWKKGFVSGAVRHISYGIFEGYDSNSQSTGKYQSGDTWINGVFSKQFNTLPLRIGFGSQFYSSSLKDTYIRALSFSAGIEFYIHRYQTTIGVSQHQFGHVFGSDIYGILQSKTVLSASKKLAHLPLTLFLDSILSEDETPEIFLGGEFNLKNGLHIRWGTSTRKIDHNLNLDFLRTVLGASGFGFGYDANSITIHYGTFIYGAGATIHGLEIGIHF